MIQPEEVASHLSDLAPYFTVACEAQVIDFSRRTHYGPWVKLRVPETGILEGMQSGQRYTLLMVRIGDDEMPVSNEHKPYRLSQIAGMLCSQEDFRAWIKHAYGEDIPDKDAAAQWVRESCGVESRAYLDSVESAAEIFRNIMNDYDTWKQQREGGG